MVFYHAIFYYIIPASIIFDSIYNELNLIMGKNRNGSGLNTNSGWVEDQNFANFFKEYIEDDIYKSDADENLKTFITYRSLYTIYINMQKAQEQIKALDENFATINDCLLRIDKGLLQLPKIIAAQEKINKVAKFSSRLLLVVAIILVAVWGYLAFEIIFMGKFFFG